MRAESEIIDTLIVEKDEDFPELCEKLQINKEILVRGEGDIKKLKILLTAYNSYDKFPIVVTISKVPILCDTTNNAVILRYQLQRWKDME